MPSYINNTPGDQDEWEYEYSATETETFYIDVDLSSVNGVIKSQSAGKRRNLKDRGSKMKNPTTMGNQGQADPANNDDQDDNDNDNDDAAADDFDNADPNSPAQPESPRDQSLRDANHTDRLQYLDLDSSNPIISYNGNIYSCTWHDMIGTTLFVTKHAETPFHEPEISTDDYDLIGTSRIKLVGHRAKIVPKVNAKKRKHGEEEDVEDNDVDPNLAIPTPAPFNFHQYVPDGRSLGTIKRTNPKTNIEIKQQANFLEKLMEAKKARGETDSVRTFVDRGTVMADARRERKAKRDALVHEKQEKKRKEETPEQRLRREIHELNRRVVTGDNEALERLQEIYADLEEEAEEDGIEEVQNGDLIDDDANTNANIHASNSSAPVLVNDLARTDDSDAVHSYPQAHNLAGGGRGDGGGGGSGNGIESGDVDANTTSNADVTPHASTESNPNGEPNPATPLH